jgi:hypothetical protein
MYNHKNGITLRKISYNDLSDLKQLKDESWWGTHTTPMLNELDQVKWLEALPMNTQCLIGAYNNINVGIAIISEIDNINRFAKISGSAYKSIRNQFDTIKNTATAVIDYCFEMLNLNRIDAEVLETNYTAQKYWTQHLKFIIEGKRRQAVYKCGKYYDSIILGILREEWLQQPRIQEYNGSCNKNFDHIQADKLIQRSKLYIQNL